jgi:hypothetical protein
LLLLLYAIFVCLTLLGIHLLFVGHLLLVSLQLELDLVLCPPFGHLGLVLHGLPSLLLGHLSLLNLQFDLVFLQLQLVCFFFLGCQVERLFGIG